MIELRASVPHTPEDEAVFLEIMQALAPYLKARPKMQPGEQYARWYIEAVDKEHACTRITQKSVPK